MDRARPADAGETLVEILVTVVIIGLALAAIMTGLLTATRGSGVTQGAADSSTLLTAAAERIEAATYVGCPTPATAYATARSLVATIGSGNAAAAPVTVKNVSIWDGDSFNATSDATACTFDQSTAAPAAGDRMQRITLAQGDATLTFIKRSG